MAVALQVVGVIALSIAGGFVHPALGIAVAGIGCLLFGIALERGKDRN